MFSQFLGHGSCDSFNKQAKLVGSGDNAVNDDKIIGEHAWRLLKSFNFDPRELRGIGIQIQKLEPIKSAPASGQSVQSVLPFKNVNIPAKGKYKADRASTAPESEAGVEIQEIMPLPPPSPATSREKRVDSTTAKPNYVDPPSFSQVDMTVFEALPKELRDELEREYRRRSGSPSKVAAGPSRAKVLNAPPHRQPSHPLRQTSYPSRNVFPNSRSKIFPEKLAFGKGNNYGRITQQLAPRNGTSIYANKALLRALGLDKPKPPPVCITETELRDLNIDPEVFAMLPVKVQREQLVMARIIKKDGTIPDGPTQRKILKPSKPFTSPFRRRRRALGPKAVYVQPPVLRQQGKEKKEKLCYYETDDIQMVIEKWVTSYKHWAPKDKDIDFFSRYLLQCMESREGDTGIERAVSIIKWWLVLLRRVWAEFENKGEEAEQTDAKERTATAWWKAFREVKSRLDNVAKKRFGGKLSLK
jgi:DNA repair protein REV1